jgi:inosine-uridine nucleoside N-ribohydrolase
VAILFLALGIGSNTPVFTLMERPMLRQPAVRYPEEPVQATVGYQGNLANSRRPLYFAKGGETRKIESTPPRAIIFDTDMGSDVDDAGALAVLHKLADRGEARIAGVMFSSGRNKYGVGTCAAINAWYGRKGVPLGQYKRDDVGDPKNYYSEQIARGAYGQTAIDSAPDIVTVYKQILRKQPDQAVTIVTVGHPHVLAYLMRDMESAALVRAKVRRWIAMAYAGTSPTRDWNFGRNGAENYLREVLETWPTDLYISSEGEDIMTGNRKLPLTPAANPVREAYRLWSHPAVPGASALSRGRSSWDQIAVLFAVRPQYFEVEDGGSLEQAANFKTFWNPARQNPKHHRVMIRIRKDTLADIIEDLMAEPPARGRASL